jgi:hypothetical protein
MRTYDLAGLVVVDIFFELMMTTSSSSILTFRTLKPMHPFERSSGVLHSADFSISPRS